MVRQMSFRWGQGYRTHLTFIRAYNPPANDPTKGYSNDFTIKFTNSSSSIFLRAFCPELYN